MVHHLALFPWHVSHSFLAIEQLCLRRAILKMLNRPTFMRRAMNPARGRRLNAMLP